MARMNRNNQTGPKLRICYPIWYISPTKNVMYVYSLLLALNDILSIRLLHLLTVVLLFSFSEKFKENVLPVYSSFTRWLLLAR